MGEGVWEADGSLPLRELEELTGETAREEGVTTVSGWVTHRLGGFPKVADALTLGTYELRVEEVAGMRVSRLTITKRAEHDMNVSM
jgi:CBS domain containing-hemolysin-like protein